MVWVPAGSFLMSTGEATIQKHEMLSPPRFVLGELASEQPQYELHLTTGWRIDKHGRYDNASHSYGTILFGLVYGYLVPALMWA